MKQALRLVALMMGASVLLSGCQSVNRVPMQSLACTLPAAPAQPPGLYAQFFGTSTILVSDGTTSIMVDGFLSRPELMEIVLGLFRVTPNEGRIADALTRGRVCDVDVLLVAQSHFDHAMDAPVVAKRTGALLVGSESTRNIARGAGFDEARFHLIDERVPLPHRDFEISFFKSRHARTKYPWMEWLAGPEGHITKPLYPPATLREYKLGANYNFLLTHRAGNLLIVPSANIPLPLRGAKADVVFLSIGNLDQLSDDAIRAYWIQAVTETGAKLVIPIHWDNFFRSLEKPLKPSPKLFDDTECAMEVIKRLAGDTVQIRFMPLFERVPLPINRKREAGSRSSSNAAAAVSAVEMPPCRAAPVSAPAVPE
jgi:L-ascorbate metabolism protein UlaG (beta-lactamase superfamily)